MTTNLIIQAEEITTPDLKTLHALSHADSIEQIAGVDHQAFRLTKADPVTIAAVATHCTQAKLDFAFVDAGKRLADFGLLAMDMDSTLITIECIDEIADFVGKKTEVAAVTAAAMRGEIDWPQSLRQRVSLLAGLNESALQSVYDERLRLSPGAEKLIHAAKKANIKTLLVSGGFTFFSEHLRERLGLDYAFSNTLEIIDGKLTGRVLGALCDADAKQQHVRDTAQMLGFGREQLIVMGDGANDLKMMSETDCSVAYRAKPTVQAQAKFALNHVGLDGVLAWFQ